jgi:hypothetical protein
VQPWLLLAAAAGVALVAVVVTLYVTGQSENGATTMTSPVGTAEPGDEPIAETGDEPAPVEETTPSATADTTEDVELATLPTTPSTDPAELVPQLVLALEILQNDAATDDEHRLAGEFEQVASRTLARAPAGRRNATLAGLSGDAASIIGNDVSAAQALYQIASPQESLPTTWHVVQPPPEDELLIYYQNAASATGLEWEYLAAIHLVETRMGRIRGNSSAGAQGPMQFMPETWQTYGQGGDIQDAEDSIMAAARLLRARGGPGDMRGALYGYNPSEAYVEAVTRYADNLRSHPWTYRGYWSWRVLYRHVDGTYVIPDGYPDAPAYLL